MAAAEHASVASFARFAAQLLALGAPAVLVREALQAAVDEAHHAELALGQAVRHGGRPLEFGSLDVRGATEASLDLERVVLACVREGCVGETLAALELARAAECCEDAELGEALARVADDEARHAALAWRFVQWALGQEPRLRAVVRRAFAALRVSDAMPDQLGSDAATRSLGSGAMTRLDTAQRRMLRAHGCLPAAERCAVEREGLRELVWPCAEALCGVDRSGLERLDAQHAMS
jgi:hypothetical protein